MMQNNRTVLVTAASSHRPSRLYLALGTSITIFVWMAVFGPWLDRSSRLTSLVSLGGHHIVVMVVSGVAAAVLAALAPLTAGFTMLSRGQAMLGAAACVLTLIAAAGLLSLLVAAVLLRIFVVGSVSSLIPRPRR